MSRVDVTRITETGDCIRCEIIFNSVIFLSAIFASPKMGVSRIAIFLRFRYDNRLPLFSLR